MQVLSPRLRRCLPTSITPSTDYYLTRGRFPALPMPGGPGPAAIPILAPHVSLLTQHGSVYLRSIQALLSLWAEMLFALLERC